jgi:tetratricopeptide (TPR) repeat protein
MSPTYRKQLSTADDRYGDKPRATCEGTGRQTSALLAVALVLGLALALRARPLAAGLLFNLGSARQTHAELSLFDAERAEDPTLDEVRRSVDLSQAEERYTQALNWDPGHSQARVQLAQIALSRGAYAVALEQAQSAWRAEPSDWRARLTLGDALIAEGQLAEGLDLVRGLPRAEARLDCWAYYRHWENREFDRAADAWRAVVLLNPENTRAAEFAEQAELKALTE